MLLADEPGVLDRFVADVLDVGAGADDADVVCRSTRGRGVLAGVGGRGSLIRGWDVPLWGCSVFRAISTLPSHPSLASLPNHDLPNRSLTLPDQKPNPNPRHIKPIQKVLNPPPQNISTQLLLPLQHAGRHRSDSGIMPVLDGLEEFCELVVVFVDLGGPVDAGGWGGEVSVWGTER